MRADASVNDVATSLGLRQPQAPKHLRVLREVGLVSVRRSGQLRSYTLSGEGLRPIHDWVERLWNETSIA